MRSSENMGPCFSFIGLINTLRCVNDHLTFLFVYLFFESFSSQNGGWCSTFNRHLSTHHIYPWCQRSLTLAKLPNSVLRERNRRERLKSLVTISMKVQRRIAWLSTSRRTSFVYYFLVRARVVRFLSLSHNIHTTFTQSHHIQESRPLSKVRLFAPPLPSITHPDHLTPISTWNTQRAYGRRNAPLGASSYNSTSCVLSSEYLMLSERKCTAKYLIHLPLLKVKKKIAVTTITANQASSFLINIDYSSSASLPSAKSTLTSNGF